jgi:hypothetical protein
MIDTDKEVKDILFNLGVEGNEYGDLTEYISNLLAEVKRLREAIADIAINMEAADELYMGGFIDDLRKVIE